MSWREWTRPAAALGASALVLFGARAALAPVAARNAAAELEATLATLLPGGGPFTREEYGGEDAAISAVYQGGNGCVVETVTDGYAGDITMLVAVDRAGVVVGLVVRDLEETRGLGGRVLTDAGYLAQYLGGTGKAAVSEDIDALTGATVTSKAVTKAVNSASAYVTGADVNSGATEWGG